MQTLLMILLATLFSVMSVRSENPTHWAYLPPVASDSRATIDQFIDGQMDTVGLARQEREDAARLIRRIYFDLIGLPPSIDEVDGFVADPSPAHYEKIVDRLLSSPRFGEKWAIGWLDLARYADSDGFQHDHFRNLWPFRDWVIRAFNSDMPYDQFTIEQLAGDLLPSPSDEQLIATGFHRGAMLNLEGGIDAEEDRVRQVTDRVNTTGTVWLATTFECSQCHDHRTDPVSIKDYYAMYAFFDSSEQESREKPDIEEVEMEYIGPEVAVPLTEKEAKARAQAAEECLEAKVVFVERMDLLCRNLPKEKRAGLSAEALALLKKPSRTFKESKALRRKMELEQAEADELNALESEVYKHKRHSKEGFFQVKFSSLIMRELSFPRQTFVLTRGDFLRPGERVFPATPKGLGPRLKGQPRNRLGLARWLVSRDNPLTARVAVNRIWAELFGRGIVTTVGDFGVGGAKPTHPELLDWLAVKFRDDDSWSMKKTIRRIVLSGTYQQRSATTASLRKKDPSNALYTRGPSRRLTAELIRDNALSIAGLLSDEMHGPPVRPVQPENIWRVVGDSDNNYYLSSGNDLYRRGIYTIWRRSAHYPSLANFDAPDRCSSTFVRQVSNTPAQALTLMNDPVYVEMAEAFAARVAAEVGDQPLDTQLSYAFKLAVARQPDARELAVLRKIHNVSGGDAGWFDVTTAILNLHQTITR